MNSVHEQCPNSDPKQCTVTKLGCVHSAHTQKPGRAHTARVVPRSWALLRARQASRTRMHAWSRAQLRLVRLPPSRPKAQVMTPNHHKAAKTMSRHQIGVATPLKPIQVATSKRGCDAKFTVSSCDAKFPGRQA